MAQDPADGFLGQSASDRDGHRGSSGVHTQLLIYAREVRLDRAFGDAKLRRNLTAARAGSDCSQHLALTRRETRFTLGDRRRGLGDRLARACAADRESRFQGGYCVRHDAGRAERRDSRASNRHRVTARARAVTTLDQGDAR